MNNNNDNNSEDKYKKKDTRNPWFKGVCTSAEHNFPSMLYIPPGSSHTHKCPCCGEETTVHGIQIYSLRAGNPTPCGWGGMRPLASARNNGK